MTGLEGLLHQIAREARVAANCAIPGWKHSIVFTDVLAASKLQQAVPIGSYPTRSTEPNELVQIDLDVFDGIADRSTLACQLRMELEPFIIGVGKIRAIDTCKELIILAADEGKRVSLGHDVTPTSDDLDS